MKNLSSIALKREQQPDTNECQIRTSSPTTEEEEEEEERILFSPTRSPNSSSLSSNLSNESVSPQIDRQSSLAIKDLCDSVDDHHTMLNLTENERLDCNRLAAYDAEQHSPSTQTGSYSSTKEDVTADVIKVTDKSNNVDLDADDDQDRSSGASTTKASNWPSIEQAKQTVKLKLLVRKREAGALIGKRGTNIKRLRETFRSSMFNIPDTGNGPERVVFIASHESFIQPILADVTQLLMEKSPEKDEQIELKLLIHSSQAGSIIGMGGQSIKKLRNDSKAAIKIYEICCPYSNERVCAIKAKPPVVVSTVKMIQAILDENPIKGTIKPYDALHFDLATVEKYGGYLPEEGLIELMNTHCEPNMHLYTRQIHDSPHSAKKHYSVWRSAKEYDKTSSYDVHHETPQGSLRSRTPERMALHLNHHQQQQSLDKLECSQVTANHHDALTYNSGSIKADARKPIEKCNGELKPSHQAHRNLTRFHPYSQLPNQIDFSPCRLSLQRSFPLSNYPTRFSFEGPSHPHPHPHHHILHHPHYNRVQNTFSGLSNGFQDSQRPCLCMFMPLIPNGPMAHPLPYNRLSETNSHDHGGAGGGAYPRGNQSRTILPKKK